MSSKIIGCGALFYTLDTQRFLVLHRVQSKQNHVWGLVGGTTVNENLWEGLHREIKEEVGILVNNVRYIKSQSWPFPSQLMLGFHADYVSGEIVVEPTELEEAAWFDIADLPSVPSAEISVAGELIQLYKEEIERIKA